MQQLFSVPCIWHAKLDICTEHPSILLHVRYSIWFNISLPGDLITTFITRILSGKLGGNYSETHGRIMLEASQLPVSLYANTGTYCIRYKPETFQLVRIPNVQVLFHLYRANENKPKHGLTKQWMIKKQILLNSLPCMQDERRQK